MPMTPDAVFPSNAGMVNGDTCVCVCVCVRVCVERKTEGSEREREREKQEQETTLDWAIKRIGNDDGKVNKVKCNEVKSCGMSEVLLKDNDNAETIKPITNVSIATISLLSASDSHLRSTRVGVQL